MTPFTNLNPQVRREFIGFGSIAPPKNTAYRMRDIIRESSSNVYIRGWAEKIVEQVPDRDKHGEVEAVYTFLQNNTRYANDPRGAEYVQTPPFVLRHIEIGDRPSLDCDDYTVTGLSLLRSLGYETIVRIVSFRPDGKFTHVFGLVKIGDQWTPFDAVRKNVPLGWMAPGITAHMDIEV